MSEADLSVFTRLLGNSGGLLLVPFRLYFGGSVALTANASFLRTQEEVIPKTFL